MRGLSIKRENMKLFNSSKKRDQKKRLINIL